MMGYMDRSLAFTALLELDTGFRRLDMRQAGDRISALLRDFYLQSEDPGGVNMWDFTRAWLAAHPGGCYRCACPCGNAATCGCSDPSSPAYLPPGRGINEGPGETLTPFQQAAKTAQAPAAKDDGMVHGRLFTRALELCEQADGGVTCETCNARPGTACSHATSHRRNSELRHPHKARWEDWRESRRDQGGGSW